MPDLSERRYADHVVTRGSDKWIERAALLLPWAGALLLLAATTRRQRSAVAGDGTFA